MRCTGHCCLDIGLRVTPEELKASHEWENSDKTGKTPERDWLEINTIYPMLVFTHTDHFHPESPNLKRDDEIHHYTCNNFDRENKLCKIYNERPHMCRVFAAEEKTCQIIGCTKTAKDEQITT